jgi:hypothetical protein
MSKAAYNVYAAGGAATPTYIEDVFSTYLYTGTGSAVNINTGLALGTGFASTTNLPSLGRFSFKDFAKSGSNIVALGTDAGDGTIRYYYSVNSGASFSLATIDGSGSVMTGCAIYGGKMFLASNGGVFSSDLGTNSFSQISGSSAVGLIKVVNGLLFVAFSNGSNPALRYSSNGTTFTTSKGYDAVIQIKDITYGDGYYFLYATNVDTGTTSYIYRSTDLTTWTQVYSISMGYEPRIAYGYGKLVMGGAGASYNGKILYSTNYGSSFTTVTISNIGSINTEDVDFDGTNFFLRKGGYAYSSDAISWTPTDVYANYVDYSDGNYFIAPGENFPAGFVAQLSADKTITNGKGGLVWIKGRSAATGHKLIDTSRGAKKTLKSNTTAAEASETLGLTAFLSNGFRIGTDGAGGLTAEYNDSAATYTSWTFRKQPKFFDVVTYTGTGTTNIVSHNLGSMFGSIIIKKTSSTGDWLTMIRKSNGNYVGMYLNSVNDAFYDGSITSPGPSYMDSSTFNPNWISSNVASGFNDSGATYVAYLFAHNAGGFGLTGSDNVITCGSYTGNGSTGQLINCGFEPQWVLVKKSYSPDSPNSGESMILDNMRGWSKANDNALVANRSDAEAATASVSNATSLEAQGFRLYNSNGALNRSGDTYVYMAIRRGPMKVPTVGTSVFVPVTSSATGSVLTTNFPVDMGLIAGRPAEYERGISDRLRGFANADSGSWPWLVTQQTAAEALQTPSLYNANNTSIRTGAYFGSTSAVSYLFRRAPGFFDVVCYTGNGTTQNLSHNLAAVPELMIVKARSLANRSWAVYFGNNGQAMSLNNTTAARAFAGWNYTTPTSSVFSVGADSDVNSSSETYVNYLFATVAGVSKVGTYTGNSTTQTINCGFASGARFVLIKRTDASPTDWYVFDTARGIVSGNDPLLKLNTRTIETSYDIVDPNSSGFTINGDVVEQINADGGTYIFLAIA